MRQFLSNTQSPTLVQAREGPPTFAPSPRKHSKALVVAMIGVTSSGIGVGYLTHEHPTGPVFSSLLSGFAPLIGLCVLLVIVSLFISFLICALERTLTDEYVGIVSEPHLKSKWQHVAPRLPDQLAHCLSLKEHSPPAIIFS